MSGCNLLSVSSISGAGTVSVSYPVASTSKLAGRRCLRPSLSLSVETLVSKLLGSCRSPGMITKSTMIEASRCLLKEISIESRIVQAKLGVHKAMSTRDGEDKAETSAGIEDYVFIRLVCHDKPYFFYLGRCYCNVVNGSV
jgi:hypothetical protein